MYNRSSTINRAVNSILAQTYQNYELIIIDDGSIDNSVDKVKKYLKNDKVFLKILGENKGVNFARNSGLKSIADDSDYVTFLDSDDEFKHDSLQKMSSVIARNTEIKDFCFSVEDHNKQNYSYIEQDELTLDYSTILCDSDKVNGEWVHAIDANLIRNNEFLYETKIKNGFEGIAYLRLAKKYPALYSKKIVRTYYTDAEGLTRGGKKSPEKCQDELIGHNIFLQENGKVLRLNRKKYSKLCAVIGKTYLDNSELSKSTKFTFKSFFYNPAEPRCYRNFIYILMSLIRFR